ncbi:MAG: ACP S-malonyltransferase [Solirubrobacteraceae bacterium]
MPTAILFPGQGSQTPEMRERVEALRPDLLELVTDCVGEDPFPRADEDTRFAQPAILVASLANWGTLTEEEPAAVAGHSLGELSALAAAEVISERDAVRLATLRGRLMSESGARQGDGTMLAALGGEEADVTRVADECGVVVANDNAPGQLVLSGARTALTAAGTALRDSGVRVVELNVAGAFHSPFMADAVPDYVEALAATDVREARIPVWSCVTAQPVDDVRRRLAESLTAPVRWRETVLGLVGTGVDRFVDAGPGKVLDGMVKRIARDAERVCV